MSKDGLLLPQDAEQQLTEAHHPIVDWKQRFPQDLHVFWSPKHIRREFVVVDGVDAIIEQPDHDEIYPPAVVVYGDAKVGSAWEAAFDRTLPEVTEILTVQTI